MPTRNDTDAAYYGAYPAKHRRVVIRSRVFACVWMFAVVLLAALTTYLWFALPELFDLRLALSGGVVVLVVWFMRPVKPRPRIIPYFTKHTHKRRIAGDAFIRGMYLAKHCKSLDAVCLRHGVKQLSDFGFNDDLCDEEVVWHDVDAGIKTFATLSAALADPPSPFEDRAEIIRDLSAIQTTLEAHRALGIRFCLLLRYGNTMSGVEATIREGTFF